MTHGQFRSPSTTVAALAAAAEPVDAEPVDAELWRRQIRHDIHHELGTIIMLASAVAVSDDVGPRSRERIEQLIGETRWLGHLLTRLDGDDESPAMASPEPIRVDELTAEIVSSLRLATPQRLGLVCQPAWAHVDRLALWRALRNVLDNACRVAAGQVDIAVSVEQGWTVIQVDDDGPGFGSGFGFGSGGSDGLASLGLGIVHDLVSGYGGRLEIRHCDLGGARVRLLLPEAVRP